MTNRRTVEQPSGLFADVVTEAEGRAPGGAIHGPPTRCGSVVPLSGGERTARGPVLRFFLAACLSMYGDWLTTVALLVILFEVTHSAAAPAGYMLVRVAPRVLGPWIGGRLTDLASARAVMIVAAALQTLFTASLIASHRTGIVWAIYVAVAGAQFVGAVGRPSQGSILPALVRDRDLPRANATYGIMLSTSIFVAPAIGAALLLRFGPDPLFAIDAASFALSAALVASLPRSGRAVPDGRSSSPAMTPRGALVYALHHRGIRVIVAASFAMGFIVTVTQAFLVVGAHDRFGGDAAVGYLYSSVGVGGLVGGLIALRWIPPSAWTRRAVLLAVTLEIVAIAGFSSSNGLVVALLLLAVSAGAGSSFDTWGITEVQRSAPAGFMGRFNSIMFVSMYAGMLVGAAWALAAAAILPWDSALELACAGALTFLLLVWAAEARQGGSPQERALRGHAPPQGLASGR